VSGHDFSRAEKRANQKTPGFSPCVIGLEGKMFLARIEGTVVATAKHPTLDGCRFLIARRLEADGTAALEPNVVVDWDGRGARRDGAGFN